MSKFSNKGPTSAFMERRVRNLSDLERAYVACAIDTEGSIIFGWVANKPWKARLKCQVTIVNTSKEWIDKLRAIIGYGTLFEGARGVGFRKKGCWALMVQRRPDVQSLLQQVQPWLVIKQGKADQVLRFFDENGLWLYGKAERLRPSLS